MNEKLNTNLKSTLGFTILIGIILSVGIIINLVADYDTYTFSLIISCILKIIPILLTCFIVDDLYRLNTKKYRKDKLLVETFLLILMILCSISYDFNLTSTILFLIIISYNFLLITNEFVKRR